MYVNFALINRWSSTHRVLCSDVDPIHYFRSTSNAILHSQEIVFCQRLVFWFFKQVGKEFYLCAFVFSVTEIVAKQNVLYILKLTYRTEM